MADGLSALSSENLTAAVTCLLHKPLPESQFIKSTPVTNKDQTKHLTLGSPTQRVRPQYAKLQPLTLPVYQAAIQNKDAISSQQSRESGQGQVLLQQSEVTSHVKEQDVQQIHNNKIQISVDNIHLALSSSSETVRTQEPIVQDTAGTAPCLLTNLQHSGVNTTHNTLKQPVNNAQLQNIAALIGHRNNILLQGTPLQTNGTPGLLQSIAGQGPAGIALLQQLINFQSHNTPVDVGSLPVLQGSVTPSDVPAEPPFSQLSPTQPLQNLIHNLFSTTDSSNIAQTSPSEEEETYTVTPVSFPNLNSNADLQSSSIKQRAASLMPASKEQDSTYATHINLLLEAISKNKTLTPQQFHQIQKSILGNLESQERVQATSILDQVQSSVLQGLGQGHVEMVHSEGQETVLQFGQKPVPFVLQKTSASGQFALIPLTRVELTDNEQLQRQTCDLVKIQPKPAYLNVQTMIQPGQANFTENDQQISIETRPVETHKDSLPSTNISGQALYNTGTSHFTQGIQETGQQEVEQSYTATALNTSLNGFSADIQAVDQTQDIDHIQETCSEQHEIHTTGEETDDIITLEGMEQQQQQQLPVEDTYVFCIDCRKLCEERCDLHVNAEYKSISDTPIVSRARASLPSIFYLQQSSTSDFKDFLGVWCSECITERTRFGPVIGTHCAADLDLYKQQYHEFNPYQIGSQDNVVTVLSVEDEDNCNWMMFVRMAHSLLEQNCILYKQTNQFYLITTSEIKEHEELLLWFSRDLCQELGISEDPGVVKIKQCDYCGKYFTTKKLLNNHLKADHPDRYEFICSFEMCDKRFHTMSRLNNHMLTHMGMKPFECKRCGKRFSDASNVKAHMNIHTGVKKFSCETCGKTFRQKAHRDAHNITHTGDKNFKCSYCDKSFARQADLKTHTYRHTNELTYPCTFCQKVFYKTQALKKHLKVHTGERNYMCGKCFKGFQTKYHRDRHLKICKEKNGKESSYMSLEEVAKLDSTCDAVPLKTVKPDDHMVEQNEDYIGARLL